MFRLVAAAVVGVAVLAVGGCTANGSPSDPSPSATGTATTDVAPDTVTEHDRALIDELVDFATEPTADNFAELAFADRVHVGLGNQLHTFRTRNELAHPDGWTVDASEFRAHVGPFSALELLADHAEGDGNPMRSSGDLQVNVGEHPHCASPPQMPPAGLADLRRVSAQPADGAIDSCLAWFTVDLYVDPAGTIHAVTLDIYEP